MTQFRKKPVVIEAKQASGTPESNREIIDWTRGSATPAFMDTEVRNCSADHPDGFDYPVLKINTLEGTMTVAHGDWVIKGVKGEFYPCRRDIFEATYDEVPDADSNESSHDWRHSPSYGGQLCADCGAVKGSRRGGLKCSDPHAGAATVTIPVVDPGPDSLEREIKAKADNGPRVTPAALKDEIASAYYFTADEGVYGHETLNSESVSTPEPQGPLGLLTICVLELRNGFTVLGHSACASPENFNWEIGKRIARENAERQIWPLLGFRLRDELARPVLTDADAAADLAGTPRPT